MTYAVVGARHDVTVAVVREKGARFQIERASIDPPRPDDVIVRVVATGVCHTDMLVRDQDYPVLRDRLSERNWAISIVLPNYLRWLAPRPFNSLTADR